MDDEKKFTIFNKDLANNLMAIAVMCAGNGTDGCDIELENKLGKINCHIEFSDIEEKQGEE